jgi:hypothetical protein
LAALNPAYDNSYDTLPITNRGVTIWMNFSLFGQKYGQVKCDQSHPSNLIDQHSEGGFEKGFVKSPIGKVPFMY